MNKVIDSFFVGKYNVLVMDKKIPNTLFSDVKIDDVIYKATVPYDIPNSVAIEADGDFTEKAVDFL